MNLNKVILILLNLGFIFFGLLVGYALNLQVTPFNFGFSPIIVGIVLSFAFFVLSVSFFGMLSPILFFYFGLLHSSLLLQNPLGILGYAIALAVSSNAGSLLGEAISGEMGSKKKIADYRNQIAIYLAAGIILGAIAGYIFGLGLTAELLSTAKIRI